jgi:hypothetical protein
MQKYLLSLLYSSVLLTVFVGPVLGQYSVPKTVNDALLLLEELQSDLRKIDLEFDDRINKEISKQVSIAPKDEFETSQQYNARLTKARLLRNQLETRFDQERKERKAKISDEINATLDPEFELPVTVRLNPYDADKEFFAASVIEKDGTEHSEIIKVPRSNARRFKEEIDSSEWKGLYGVKYGPNNAYHYYFGVKIKWNGQNYSSLPPVLALTENQKQQYYGVYKEPTVVYLRRVINRYIKDRNSVTDLEREALDAIDSDYFDSKFVVMSIDPFIAGGKYIKVIFQSRPDAVFAVWIYRILELRSFEKQDIGDREMRVIRSVYRPFLSDRLRAL